MRLGRENLEAHDHQCAEWMRTWKDFEISRSSLSRLMSSLDESRPPSVMLYYSLGPEDVFPYLKNAKYCFGVESERLCLL